MTLAPDHFTAPQAGEPTPPPEYAELSDGQMMLFGEAPLEPTKLNPAGELVFPLTAVIDFEAKGTPSADAPELPVLGVRLYDTDSAKPIIEVDPDEGEEIVANSLYEAVRRLEHAIFSRWDIRHADLSAMQPPATGPAIGGISDHEDWKVKTEEQ